MRRRPQKKQPNLPSCRGKFPPRRRPGFGVTLNESLLSKVEEVFHFS
jgi:hypothetical protein